MKLAVALVSLCFAVGAIASESNTTVGNISILTPEGPHHWAVEGLFNTVSNSYVPTFGPVLLYNLNPTNQIGARVLAPIGNTDNGAYTVSALYRHYFSEKETSLFLEGAFSTNMYYYGAPRSTFFAQSVGTDLGIIHRLTADLSVGGLAGFEWTQTKIERNLATNESDIYAWPRVGIFGSIAF